MHGNAQRVVPPACHFVPTEFKDHPTMTVALPPPTVPSQADATEVRRDAVVGTLRFEDYTLHLHGADVIRQADIDTITANARNLSDVVQLLNRACYIAGYPACKTTYARVDDQVYVHFDLRGVDSVKAAAPMAQYFSGLADDGPLTDGALERRRYLANAHARRAGLTVQPAVTTGDNGGTELDLATVTEDGPPLRVITDFGNGGTRFVGRYLASVQAALGTRWGDQITVGAREGISNLGDNPNDGNYREVNAGAGRVTPWGIFGISYRSVNYDFVTEGFAVDADIRSPEMSWLYPWLAGFNHRLVTQVTVARTDSQTQLAGGPPGTLLDERYNTVEVSATFTRNSTLGERTVQTETSLTVRRGLKDQVAVPTGADLDFTLLRPQFTVTVPVFTGWTFSTAALAQFSSDTVPQQSQWVLGGDGSLSAFLPGAAAGDEGVLGRIQLATPPLQRLGITVRPALVLAGGTARRNANDSEVRLADVGGRMDLAWGRHLSGALSYAVDLADDNRERADGKANLFFSLRLTF